MRHQYAQPRNGSEAATATQAAAATLSFAFRETSLGVALIAATSKGVRTIFLGDERPALLGELRQSAPSAIPAPPGSAVDEWADDVAAWLDAPGSELAAPLDMKGTEFQRAVWNELREIPFGATTTYTEIASRIGRPRAVRAVAGACAMNSLAVAVPCHRVVRSDGNISGYRWGVELKRRLLERESLRADD